MTGDMYPKVKDVYGLVHYKIGVVTKAAWSEDRTVTACDVIVETVPCGRNATAITCFNCLLGRGGRI